MFFFVWRREGGRGEGEKVWVMEIFCFSHFRRRSRTSLICDSTWSFKRHRFCWPWGLPPCSPPQPWLVLVMSSWWWDFGWNGKGFEFRNALNVLKVSDWLYSSLNVIWKIWKWKKKNFFFFLETDFFFFFW